MQNVTVTCACGRKMRVNALGGRGAFRCGCGAGVRVEVSDIRRGCAVDGCRLTAVADSLVVRLCSDHLHKVMLSLVPRIYVKYPPEKWLSEAIHEYVAEFGEPPETPLWVRMPWLLNRVTDRPDTSHDPIVYFLVIGDKVKIGTTINKRQRFASMLPPGATFALELPGSYKLESELHKRFAADRLEGEWFRLSDQIKAFIAANQKRMARSSATSRSRRSSASTRCPAATPTDSPASASGDATATRTAGSVTAGSTSTTR